MSFERRKIRVGRVVGDKMDKTVVVSVEWRTSHPLYRKAIRRRTRFRAHDAENQCRIGDLVRLIETRPTSKTKRWRVTEILAREDIAEVQPDEIAVDESVMTARASVAEEPVAAVAVAVDELEPEEPAAEPDEEEAVVEEEPTVAEVEETEEPADGEEEEPAAEPEEEEAAVEEEPADEEEEETEGPVDEAEDEQTAEPEEAELEETEESEGEVGAIEEEQTEEPAETDGEEPGEDKASVS
ncbi:MAG: 30S ribosomal protein S17 [Chloroflexi bacterium]|nr:30S ribosomal protein S17 [Chloroflexota bacterium]